MGMRPQGGVSVGVWKYGYETWWGEYRNGSMGMGLLYGF